MRPLTRPRQAKDPPRVCAGCGRLRRHEALGLCSACWQRHPDRPFVRGQHLAARLAAGRRQRRIDAAPDALRPAVAAFAAWMLRARERARRAGTRPRADGTIKAALATLRDLARS